MSLAASLLSDSSLALKEIADRASGTLMLKVRDDCQLPIADFELPI